jgi:GNAT superfamily N-acetyltransferase
MAMPSGAQLKDGRTVWLRVAGAADVPAIAGLYSALSSAAFRSRFQAGQPTTALVARLAGLSEPAGTVCVVAGEEAAAAAEPGLLIAEARYVPLGEGTAELALTVRDDYQGAGLGRILLGELAERAPASRIERLRAIVSLSNAAMLHLLAPYGWVLAEPTDECSIACLEISATGGMPGWPAGVTGRRVLVEQRGWYDTGRVAALRAAGDDVRQCHGPSRHAGRTCPLVTSGHCRLAEEADVIVPLLPPDDGDCAAVLDAHRRRWPGRLAP